MFIAVFLLQKQVSSVEYENLKRIYCVYFKRLIQDRNFNATLCGQCRIHAKIQCLYNVTLRGLRVTTVVVGKQ